MLNVMTTDLPTDEPSATSATSATYTKTPFLWTLIVLLWIAAILTFLGNVLVLISFAMDKKLNKVNFNLFILNLAVTDVCVSVVAMPLFAIEIYYGGWPYDQVSCAIWIFLDWGMTFESIFTLVAISIDRYWAACWPNSYRHLNVTKTRTFISIGLTWLCLIVIWVPPWLKDRLRWSEPGMCIWEVTKNREFAVFMAVCGYHLPTIIMIFCYCKVFNVMRRSGAVFVKKVVPSTSATDATSSMNHSDTIKSKDNPKTRETKKQVQMAKDRRIFVSLSYIIVAYLVTWSPFHIIFDVLYFKPDAVTYEWYCFAYWCCYCNSMLNPILYAASNKDFRSAFKDIITCKYFRALVEQ